MQVYAMRFFNFLRFGETNNSIVFDLTEQQKRDIKSGAITMDQIYDLVMSNPTEHVREAKKRGIESILGITGIIDGNIDSSNGCGKSSIMEGICYSHYEKIARKTVNTEKVEKAGLSVVTKIDGKYPTSLQESYVEELMEENGRLYRIKRGRIFSKNQKTNTPIIEFDCINDDSVDSQSGHRSKDTKNAIDDVITMDYDVFINSQMFAQNDAGKYLMGTDKTKKEMLISLLKLENVVAGCLDLLRTRKNAQDKKVQSIEANINVLQDFFIGAYADITHTQANQLVFDDSFVEKVIGNISLSRFEAQESIRVIEKEIACLEAKVVELGKSEKLTTIEAIKEEGKKTNKEKKTKEQDLASQIAEWEKLKKEVQNNISSKKSQLNSISKEILHNDNQIALTEAEINKFIIEDYNNKISIIQRAKDAKPKFEKNKIQLSKDRDVLIQEIAKLQSNISNNISEISKFQRQIDSIDKDGVLVCHECKSVVSKEHISSKMEENKKIKEEREASLVVFEQDRMKKDQEIKTTNDKLKKINDYLVEESKIQSEYSSVQEKKKRLVELKDQLEKSNQWKSVVLKEIEDLSKKEFEYNQKCISITESFDKDMKLLGNKIQELVLKLKQAEEEAKAIVSQIESVRKTQRDISEKKNKQLEKIGSLDKDKERCEKDRDTLNEKKELLKKEAKVLSRYKVLDEIFGLDGIQTRIVKKYLPLLNVYIKEFLDILSNGEMSVKMIINEKSKVDIIITGGTADTFEMLSGGERMIVRLATDIGLALLAFSRSSQKPEIICLDEIFANLDKAHIEAVFKVFNKLQDKFSRVLIVSHDTEINERIQSHIVIEKQSGRFGMSKIVRIT